MANVYKPTHPDPETGERVKGKYWYIDYRDAEGRTRTVKGLRGRAATMLMAVELERRAAGSQGGASAPTRAKRRRSLREHVDDFQRALAAGRGTARRAAATVRRLRAVLEGCGFFGPTEIEASRVKQWVRERRTRAGLSAAASRDHVQALKAFTAWLLREGRIAHDPMAGSLRMPDTDTRYGS